MDALDLRDKNRKKKKNFKNLISSYLPSKSHFEDERRQNYLVFQPVSKYFKAPTNSNSIIVWKSKSLSGEVIKPLGASDNSIAPGMIFSGAKIRVKLDGSCLKQEKIIFNHKSIINLYIKNLWSYGQCANFTL